MAMTTWAPKPGDKFLSLSPPGNPHLPSHLLGSRSSLEDESRRRYQTAYLGGQTLLCRVLGKYLLFADTTDSGIAPHLALDGYWESWITQAVARVLRPGWTCIDVGANHGYYTLIFADAVGPAGKVVACEPNPPVADLLTRTLQVNGFSGRVQVVRQAIAGTDNALTRLVIPSGLGLNATIDPGRSDGVPVSTVTLDTVCRSFPRIDFIKIDAEGAEQDIWHGMQETLARNPDVLVLLEFNANRYANPRGFLAAIESAGFRLSHVDFDSQIKPLTADEVLELRPREDWMLWLRRD